MTKSILRTLIAPASAALMLLAASCSTIAPSNSGFGDVTIGMTKQEVVKKYGKPLLENLSEQDGKQYNALTYVKSVYVSGEWREIRTELFFVDSKLVDKVEQILPPKSHHP